MPNPVSLLVWRDAKTDPPTGPARGVLAQFADGSVWTAFANALHDSTWGTLDDRVVLWAELPVVTDLTDEDLEDIKDMAEAWLYKVGASPDAMDRETVGRLRAALGGKEEA